MDDFEDLAQEKKTDTGFFGGHREPVKGRKWDHAREGEPVIMQSGRASASPWHTFLMSSMYGPAPAEDGKKVDADFLQQQTPGYMKPWRGDLDENADPEKLSGLLHNKKRRKSFINRLQVSRHLERNKRRTDLHSMSFSCILLFRWYFESLSSRHLLSHSVFLVPSTIFRINISIPKIHQRLWQSS